MSRVLPEVAITLQDALGFDRPAGGMAPYSKICISVRLGL